MKYHRRMQFYKVGPSCWHSHHTHFLLKPPRAIPYAPEESMLQAIRSLDRRSLPVIEKTCSWRIFIHGVLNRAKCIFSSTFLISHTSYIHGIPQSLNAQVAPQFAQENDNVGELPFTERRQIFFKHNPPKCPSSEAQPNNFHHECSTEQEHSHFVWSPSRTYGASLPA